MMLTYSHANKETNVILERAEASPEPLVVLRTWLNRSHFVYHEKAEKCAEHLRLIFEDSYYFRTESRFPIDRVTMTLIGESGSGKSAIIEEFMSHHSPEHHPGYEGYPVVHCMLKDAVTGLKGLYSAILTEFGHPMADPDVFRMKKTTVDQLEEILIHNLRATKTALLFIDEAQHVISRTSQPILNMLKRTMLVSQVPFVLSGTPDVEKLLATDPQLADRCPVKPYSRLEYWEFGNDYRRFLKGYEEFLPFPEPSHLSGRDIAYTIFQKIQFQNGKWYGKTNLRRITEYIKKVSKYALNKHLDCITIDEINAVDP